jgi:hypothetical protein
LNTNTSSSSSSFSFRWKSPTLDPQRPTQILSCNPPNNWRIAKFGVLKYWNTPHTPVGKSLSARGAKERGEGGGDGATGCGHLSARPAKSPEFRCRVRANDIFHTNNKQTITHFLTHSIFLCISQIHSNIHMVYKFVYNIFKYTCLTVLLAFILGTTTRSRALYVYTSICMYIRMHACMHVCMHVHTYVCMNVCMYTRMYIRMYVCIIHTYYVLFKPPMPYIASSPLCLLRGFTSCLNFGS